MFNIGGVFKFQHKDYYGNPQTLSSSRLPPNNRFSPGVFSNPRGIPVDQMRMFQSQASHSSQQPMPQSSYNSVVMSLSEGSLSQSQPPPAFQIKEAPQGTSNGIGSVSSLGLHPIVSTPGVISTGNSSIPNNSSGVGVQGAPNGPNSESKGGQTTSMKNHKPSTIQTKRLKVGNYVFNGGKIMTKFQYGKKLIILEFQSADSSEVSYTHLKHITVKFADVEYINIDLTNTNINQNTMTITISRHSPLNLPASSSDSWLVILN